MKKNHGTNEQRQGGPLVLLLLRSTQVHSEALLQNQPIGRAVAVVTRPPACKVKGPNS